MNSVKIVVAGIMIAALILVPLAVYLIILDHSQEISQEQTITSLYTRGQMFVDRGDSQEALGSFLGIIDKDPSQEKAWHEAGKIMNRYEMCAQSLQHYWEYVERFPGSVRGQEGYEIAKMC